MRQARQVFAVGLLLLAAMGLGCSKSEAPEEPSVSSSKCCDESAGQGDRAVTDLDSLQLETAAEKEMRERVEIIHGMKADVSGPATSLPQVEYKVEIYEGAIQLDPITPEPTQENLKGPSLTDPCPTLMFPKE